MNLHKKVYTYWFRIFLVGIGMITENKPYEMQ